MTIIRPSVPPTPRRHRFVVIVGAGASGIVQAGELLRSKTLPHEEFVLLEKYPEFGGCWWKNTYPGCACDTPTHVYQVSWWKNPNWSRSYAPQEEILQYYQGLAQHLELQKNTHFNTEVTSAEWVDEEMLWYVYTRNVNTGKRGLWTCNMFLAGTGPFHTPKHPSIPGISDFQGRQWHAMEWPSNADLAKKRVAVIGTGPSAVQIVSEISKEDGIDLKVYQRSPGHCLPRDDEPYKEVTKWVFRTVPGVLEAYAGFVSLIFTFLTYRACILNTWISGLVTRWSAQWVKKLVKDPEKQKKLISPDTFGCKRPLLSNDFYLSLDRPNVEIITDSVTEITNHGIRSNNTETGEIEYRVVDVIIWATGYHMTPSPIPTTGRNGINLLDQYGAKVYCLYGLTISDFPNYGTFIGPHQVSYWTPIILVIELCARYHLQVIKKLLELNTGSYKRALVPRREREVEWVESLREPQKRLPMSEDACRSYYKTEEGVVIMWPWSCGELEKLLKKPRWDDYVVLETRAGEGVREK